MSISQELAKTVTAANTLTQTVTDKIGSIDQRVSTFESEARNIANQATNQMYRSRTGIWQSPAKIIEISPQDDAGALVQQAYDDGFKYVQVKWEADGQDRHWNTLVKMPVGATISILGPWSNVTKLGGNVRSDRACYASGRNQGTSELGSPLIFRNLETDEEPFPANTYAKVWDVGALIFANGNNTILFGEGTYLHDQGGLTPSGEGNALITFGPYLSDLPVYVGGGGHDTQFYLSGPLVNHLGGCTTGEIMFYSAHFSKVSSDGQPLTVDKGYRRLLNKGVSGVTSALLDKQPYELTNEEATYNDNDIVSMNQHWLSIMRGTEAEADRPRLLSLATLHHPGGYVICQFRSHGGQCSLHGLDKIGGTTDSETYVYSR